MFWRLQWNSVRVSKWRDNRVQMQRKSILWLLSVPSDHIFLNLPLFLHFSFIIHSLCFWKQNSWMSENCRVISSGLDILPDHIHDSVCQIKEIPPQTHPEVTRLSVSHTREAACWLIISHKACCLSVLLQWQMIPYLEGCCLLLLSNVLATSLSSLEPSGASAASFSCQGPHYHYPYAHLRMHNQSCVRFKVQLCRESNFLWFVHRLRLYFICCFLSDLSRPTHTLMNFTFACKSNEDRRVD